MLIKPSFYDESRKNITSVHSPNVCVYLHNDICKNINIQYIWKLEWKFQRKQKTDRLNMSYEIGIMTIGYKENTFEWIVENNQYDYLLKMCNEFKDI